MFSAPGPKNIQCFKNHGITDYATSEHLCSSCVREVKFEYDWGVHFVHLSSPDFAFGIEVTSPEFPNRTNSEITWYLTIEPLYLTDVNMVINLKLTLASSHIKKIKASYAIYFYDRHEHKTSLLPNEINTNVFMQDEHRNAIKYNDLLVGSFAGSIFNLHCDIVIINSELHPTEPISKKLTDSNFTFLEELESIFKNEEFSDVTFSANGKELKLHKVILAARSPVFNAMFKHEMIEMKHNRVEITDIEFDVLRELMSYIYTGNITDLDKNAKELLVAADKYDIEKLKVKCEIVLCEQVSTETVAEMFIFADTLNLAKLREKAKNYIIGNAKDVSGTPQWQSFIVTHPQLLAEAFLAIAIKLSEK